MEQITEVFNHSLMITGFVFVMMLVIEYFNVLTRGAWQQRVASSFLGQYIFAAFMGIIPGCLGAFLIVAMFTGRMVSLGAVVTAMIATSGDEAFVMLSMIPKETFLLMGILFVLGTATGMLTDFILKANRINYKPDYCEGYQLHTQDACRCFPKGEIFAQWKESSPNRIILAVVLSLFIIAIASGQVGPEEWNWVRVSILFVTGLALFIVTTVPEHFLKKHLWSHVATRHVPRIFAWTFGALMLMHLLINHLHLHLLIQQNLYAVLGFASLLGLIPESGPHLIFVTLFANGSIPFSILLASSIVQDGHGTLPLLAHSPRSFIVVKIINLVAGVLVGTILLLFTY